MSMFSMSVALAELVIIGILTLFVRLLFMMFSYNTKSEHGRVKLK
ncbi:hypothetical protein [Halalkalibacter okhensis]|nr:hypothetical protein [Halalkalibacter okhensis]